MRTLLFLPSFPYLSFPLYESLFPEISKEFDCYYLNPHDPQLLSQSINSDPAGFKKIHFSHIPPTDTASFIKLLKFRIWSKKLTETIKDLSPHAIIITADNVSSAHVISNRLPGIPLILVQSALLNFDSHKKPHSISFLKKLVRSLFNGLLNSARPSQNFFGFSIPRLHLFLFGERSGDFYKGKIPKSQIHLVGYPAIKIKPKTEKGNFISVVLPVCHTVEDELSYYQDIINIATALPQENFIATQHPRARTEFNAMLKNKNLKNISTCSEQSYIEKSKACISSFSFMDFNLMARNIPIIHYRPVSILESHEFWFKGSPTLHCHSSKQVIDVISKNKYPALNNDTFLNNIFTALGEESCKRFITQINEILK